MQALVTPYKYQERIADLLLGEGKNVLLQAPTGAGKTRAALMPFFRGLGRNSAFPQKCIYSVPMRVLAGQFVEAYREEFTNLDIGKQATISIQTGDQPTDPEFKSTLIFATIDQTLSSFLIRPYSLPRRKANMTGGAVIASYLVFDEFHLYDPGSTLPTTLHMLQLLKGITPFILMTATFSVSMLEGLAKLLDAVIVPSKDEEQQELLCLPSQRKTRRYHLAERPLSAGAILAHHDRRSVVICNTVDRARHVFQELNKRKPDDVTLLLLHSRLLPEQRKRVEDIIRARFGKHDTGEGSFIVVSTQAIEVGVDITCQHLHTELAPANAIIQRAGRCARYEGETGDVHIYRYVDVDRHSPLDLCESVYPYVDQKDEFGITAEQFMDCSGPLTFADEQSIISAVHGRRDQQIIATLLSGAYEHKKKMFAVMRGQEDTSVQHIVRNTFQQRVTISSDPDTLLDSPFDAPAFGIFPYSLEGYVRQWLERYWANEDDIQWAVKYLYQLPRDEEAEVQGQNRYQWKRVDTWETVRGASLVVVHPAFASYHPVLGFLPNTPSDLNDPNHWEARLPDRQERHEGQRFTYRLETYEDHIALVYEAAFGNNGTWHELDNVATRLEKALNWREGSLMRAARIAMLLHDVGKLSKGWQGWVQEYQRRIGRPTEDGKAYAHTDLFEDDHYIQEKGMKARPTHAVESALASVPALAALFDNGALARAVYSAIARHHSPYSADNQAFQLVKGAEKHILATLASVLPELTSVTLSFDGMNAPLNARADAWHELVIDLNNESTDEDLAGYWAYLLIVRALRRADQLGTERGTSRYQ